MPLYAYCLNTTAPTNGQKSCDTGWNNNTKKTSVAISGLSSLTTYYWQVRAVNYFTGTYANCNTWWSFTTKK